VSPHNKFASASPLQSTAQLTAAVEVDNSSMNLDAGTATFHRFINLGMAVDTDRGLPVPNIKNVEDLTVAGLAKPIVDIARRTRGKRIQPDEITVRDHGSGRLRHRDPPGSFPTPTATPSPPSAWGDVRGCRRIGRSS
jgi:hypothetical protein